MNTSNLSYAFDTNILTWLFINTMLFFSTNTLAAYPGTYNHEKQTAFIKVYDNKTLSIDLYTKKGILLNVDFKNQKITRLGGGKNFGRLAINHDSSMLSYSDTTGTHIIDPSNGHSLFDVNTGAVRLHWADDRNIVAVTDTGSNKKIFEIDIDHRTVKSAKLNDVLWYVKWSINCEYFLYEVSDGIINVRRTVKLQDSKLRDLKTRENLTLSNDGRYYYTVKEESDDDSGQFEVFRTKDNMSVTGVYSAESTPQEIEVLWGKNTIRLLGHQSLFDLKTGKLLSPPIWFSNAETSMLNVQYPYIDMAADRSQYVLRWNYIKKYFEVEDINTGKIVRTYEKFW